MTPDSLHAQRPSIHKLFSVSYAAKTAGVSSRQLYYWEHLGIVKPIYEEFGSYSYRRYTQEQIDLLINIKNLLNTGYTLQAAIKKVKENGNESTQMVRP